VTSLEHFVRDVTDEEDRGSAERRHHALAVRLAIAGFDEDETGKEQDRAQGIQ
jgi:hypothetical protein